MSNRPNRRLRLGMVGGGNDAFIGAVHRLAARIDDRYEFVAGALSSTPDKAIESGHALGLAEDRIYPDYQTMARSEAARPDGIDVVSIVTPNHVHHGPAAAFLAAGIHVICDKPMTTTVADALDLVRRVKESGLVFGLTHNYTGYPLVRQAREMVAAGELGEIRVIQAEYAQGWLATKLEDTGMKQASWRTDPARSGAGGCIGDIGTHAYNLACFVTGQDAESLSAQLTAFVPGRKLDDDAQIMLRYASGARGMLWSSQVAVAEENGLTLRVYGTKGGLKWRQEVPNEMVFMPLGGRPQIVTRGGAGLGDAAGHSTRVPPGHPEGYQEAFATLYRDIADRIHAHLGGWEAPAHTALVPTVEDGAKGVKFIEAAVASSNANAAWTSLAF
ncbi:MAG: Gfo/Idh/MocA family oxidoreductase [Alphaproteobacteria bacterium]